MFLLFSKKLIFQKTLFAGLTLVLVNVSLNNIGVFACGMQPLPILKNGSCPYKWSSQGEYCVPLNGAKAIVSKNGPCPYGWSSQHNYCVAVNNAKPIMAKIGSCPYGWSSQHYYCVKN